MADEKKNTEGKTKPTGLTLVKEENIKDEEMIRCIVRDIYGSKRQRYYDSKKKKFVHYNLNEWVELPRREIRKLKRVIYAPGVFDPKTGESKSPEQLVRFTVETAI